MLNKTFPRALLACALLSLPALGVAQGPPRLAQAVDAAWQRAVEAAEAAGLSRRAEAASSAAQSPWAAAPAMELSQRNDRGADRRSRETGAGVVMPLWWPGQRAARAGAASAESDAARSAAMAWKWRLAGQVREAQWACFAQQAELAAAEAQLKALADLARDVERRVAAGDLAKTDSLAASAEELAAEASVLSARQKLQAARAHWQALTGLAEVPPPEPAPTQAGVPPGVPDGHPQLRAVRAGVELAERRLAAVQASRRDAPELTVAARHEATAGTGADGRGIGFALRIPFATDARNQPLLAAALSELDVAHARARRSELELASAIEVAAGELEAARRSMALEEGRATLLRDRSSLLERSYRAGNTALPDLLRALTAASQAQADLQRRQVAQGLAHARLQQALGNLP